MITHSCLFCGYVQNIRTPPLTTSMHRDSRVNIYVVFKQKCTFVTNSFLLVFRLNLTLSRWTARIISRTFSTHLVDWIWFQNGYLVGWSIGCTAANWTRKKFCNFTKTKKWLQRFQGLPSIFFFFKCYHTR